MFGKRSLLALASALLVTVPAFAAEPAHKLFMWKVTSGKSCVYLVGSIHMVPKDFYPLPPTIEKAFDDSSTLVLEIDERKADPAKLAGEGVYTDGDSIDNHIKDATKVAFNKYADAQDAPTKMALHKMRPWCAANMIGLIEVQKHGFDKDYGVDKHFLNEAVDKTKSVEELESVEFQMQCLSGFSEDLQDKMLRSSLVDLKHIDQDSKDMLSAWKTGDTALMDAVATRDEKEEPELQPVMEKLLYERNVTMVQKIEGYLKAGTPAFVVVGAAHLTGSRGIVALLKKAKKYKIEQVTSNPLGS